MREQAWPLQSDAQQPAGYGTIYGFESDFAETTADGAQLRLQTDVGEGAQTDLDQHFADLQHDALDQQAIALVLET